MKALLCLLVLFTAAYADEAELYDEDQAYYETKQFYSGDEISPYHERQFYSDGEVDSDSPGQFYYTPNEEPNYSSLFTDREFEEIVVPKLMEKLDSQLTE
ncbi:MAG: hypothetical protein EBZ49_00330 [Proteobacteria bacterium]|nr:hypothetical protein [Pseudomonadota bacterium]